MKKCALWVLLFGAAFSLFAQNAEDVTIFVPQVSGIGATPTDHVVFTDILKRELKSRNFKVKETQDEADYVLIGMLAPSNTAAGHMLSIALQDKDGMTLYEQVLFYSTQEEANIYIPTVLFNMLSSIFVLHDVVPVDQTVYVEKPVEAPAEEIEDSDAWRNRLWYISANVFWNPRIYHGTKTEFFGFNFGLGISAEFHLRKYMVENLEILYYLAVGTGLEFVSDWVVASPKINDDYRNTVLQIPLNIYGVFKPGAVSLLQPYLGILFNIPLLPGTIPPVLSWQAGFQYGIKAGKGAAYGEIRYSMDFGKSGFRANHPGDPRQYDRFMIYLGVGYKYDLIKFTKPAVDFIINTIQDIKTMTQTEKPAQEAQATGEETGNETAGEETEAAAAPE